MRVRKIHTILDATSVVRPESLSVDSSCSQQILSGIVSCILLVNVEQAEDMSLVQRLLKGINHHSRTLLTIAGSLTKEADIELVLGGGGETFMSDRMRNIRVSLYPECFARMGGSPLSCSPTANFQSYSSDRCDLTFQQSSVCLRSPPLLLSSSSSSSPLLRPNPSLYPPQPLSSRLIA
eukprot:768796-Hanusia_phi.AAC.7